ncbi:uncharacterized protein BO96DRAFT_387361 [Aspergillus niger CBS 101883]|uniref:Uncharacterized protein n=3 Tax=Aspergillus niger TaxID=5061 RepID=A2QIP1_ASPNC|nr:uncharacterized protein BO96DRAFT_387361 [Aspergillus niger CBS 101883]XP_059600531.1 hypothetical protein An04g04200 [Aspergillus niger]PYH59451.1 hypothetical protein BO96DRAFT_387361 [Aspergillus niger CBS 101883]RDH20287.1 hypothetical protein M747DRAFT_280391 [Aspergillus niger ATCC 13496]CAK38685.1 hypothetical protein An04g04200 [Aspergillus niger]
MGDARWFWLRCLGFCLWRITATTTLTTAAGSSPLRNQPPYYRPWNESRVCRPHHGPLPPSDHQSYFDATGMSWVAAHFSGAISSLVYTPSPSPFVYLFLARQAVSIARLLAGSGNSPRLGLSTRASAPPAPRSSARISVKLFNSLVRWSSVSVSPGSGSSPFVPLVFCVRHCLAEISPILLTLLATSRVPRIGVCGTRRQFLVHGVAYGSVLTDRLCRHQLVETCSKEIGMFSVPASRPGILAREISSYLPHVAWIDGQSGNDVAGLAWPFTTPVILARAGAAQWSDLFFVSRASCRHGSSHALILRGTTGSGGCLPTHFAPLLLRLYPHRGSHTNSITRGRESMLSLSLARSPGSPKIDNQIFSLYYPTTGYITAGRLEKASAKIILELQISCSPAPPGGDCFGGKSSIIRSVGCGREGRWWTSWWDCPRGYRAVWIQGPSYYSDGLGPSTTLLTPSHLCFVPTVDPICACIDPA